MCLFPLCHLVLRLFLRIRGWCIVPMPPNCQLSSSNGKLSLNLKFNKKAKEPPNVPIRLRRWRRKLVHLWLVLIVAISIVWFLVDFSGRPLAREMKSAEICEEVQMEHLNASQHKLHGLPPVLSKWNQVQCSDKDDLQKQLVSIMDIELVDEYSHPNEGFVHKYGPLKPDNTLKPHFSQYKFWNPGKVTSGLTDEGNCGHCKTSLSFCLVKRGWWAVILVILSFKISILYFKRWNKQKQNKAVQLEPVIQSQRQSSLLQQRWQQQPPGPPKGAGKWRKTLLKIVILFGIMISISLFWYWNEIISFRREEMLGNMCEERARMLQDQFNVSMNHVHALAILVSTFHHEKKPSAIDQNTFCEYTERTAFERPLTSGVAYALKVLHSQRDQFEREHGWTIKTGWATKEVESKDQTLLQDCNIANLDPVPEQDEYAPVIFSQETVSHIISIDMMSGKEDHENILRARATGKGVLTSPFKLLKSNHLGVILTFAVYDRDLPPDATSEERTDAAVGYIGASYDVPSLVEKLLQQLASKQTIVINVYDTTNISTPIKMYGDDDVVDTGLLHVSNVDFGDPLRKHQMHCRFKLKPPLPWTAINSSVGFLVITLLVGHIFQAAINRITEVEEDYQEMMELKSRAEAADVAKSQFLATVSHEIRTPMNGVLGMLQMLMDTELDANQQDYAQTAHASGKDLISLINEVLDQAKIESGRLELEHVPFDLRVVLDNVLSLFSGKSDDKQIELAVYVSDNVPETVIGDPGHFRQIITNLVGNSIKFTRRGHIFVSVHLAEEVQSHSGVRDKVLCHSLRSVKGISQRSYDTLSGYPVADRSKSWEKFKSFSGTSCYCRNDETGPVEVLVTVEDTGVGIPLDAQGQIFTPFMQADSSTSRTYGGTGIGLSISKCLVDLMHGEIGFVSEPSLGSTFSFMIPFTKKGTHLPNVTLHDCDPLVSEFQGLRALVIDYRVIRAEVTRYHLSRLGIYVDIAQNFNSASTFLSRSGQKSQQSRYTMFLIHKDVWEAEGPSEFNRLLREPQKMSKNEIFVNSPKIFLFATFIDPTERIKFKSDGFVHNMLVMPLRPSVFVAFFQEALGNGKKKLGSRKNTSSLGSLLKEKRILVVDDNIVNRRVAEGALKKYGAVITCVDSGTAAIEMLRPPHNFDVCFMDLQMPGMDGFEATKRIRSIEKEFNEKVLSGEASAEMLGNVGGWRTPILAMTADVMQASNERCIKCGMDDYVSKPFEEEQLYSAVARFFQSG
ncbi:hypothetical protein SAY87_009937 [Trapa incisa]|uniref:histidine kinase n=1 Tax=Trapa incisa TaxID=236973 RepID=A0AAN7GIS7_9MYRT|nr:hypothetical protein SAY87_009937 [Trapa incisa]